MKNLFALLVLSVSMEAMAQERVLLNSKSVKVESETATLVRTSKTPNTIEVTMKVPMINNVCVDPRSEYVQRICQNPVAEYREREVCTNTTVQVPGTPASNPRGPRYNNPGSTTTTTTETRSSCHIERYPTGRTLYVPYDCSYTNYWCARHEEVVTPEYDKVKIKFKNLPFLGGSEEETFQVTADQRVEDGTNVDYKIVPVQTLGNREYEVVKKGILGFDSFQIQPK